MEKDRKLKVFILAGGEGTRLRPLTYSVPKPLLPIGEKPVLELLIERLKSQGIREIIISVGYKSWLIKSYFSDGKKWGVQISYVDEEEKLGTAGPLKKIERMLRQPIIVLNGDLITDLNFSKMAKCHNKSNADMTVCTVDYIHRVPFGVVKSETNVLLAYDEKPEVRWPVNAGIYVVSPTVLSFIPKDVYFDMSQLLNVLLKSKRKVFTYHSTDNWFDVGGIDYVKKILENNNINAAAYPIK
jgi:NDP-sugar pyrophosphorylase family protein